MSENILVWQAWSSRHPQSVCKGELLNQIYVDGISDLKSGGPIKDEVGRLDPHKHDGDGRSKST